MFKALKLCGGVFLGVIALCGSSRAQTITLTLSDHNPPNSLYQTEGIVPWIKQVGEATSGRVKIRNFPSQTLVKGTELWKGVQAGIADIGWCFHGYWPDMTPLTDVVTLPGLPIKSAEHGSEVLTKLIAKLPVLQKEFADTYQLMYWTSSPYILLTSKKQVKTMEDLRGLKLRVSGGPPTDQIRALGGVPILIPMPDIYEAMSKGVIDGAALPWGGIHAFRLWEVGKYYTIVPLSAVYFSMCMNKQKWASLPKDVQQQMTSVSGMEGAKLQGKKTFDDAEALVMDIIKKGKYEAHRYVVPPEELARWNKVGGEPIWEEWVKRMEAKGRPQAREVLNTTLELLKE